MLKSQVLYVGNGIRSGIPYKEIFGFSSFE